MSENEYTPDAELEFLHQDPNMAIRFLLFGIAFFFSLRSSNLWWLGLLAALGAVYQRIHVIDRSNMAVSNYFGIGMPFIDLWTRLFILSTETIDGRKSVQVKGESRFWDTEHASGREKVYHVSLKCESGDVVLSTFKSRSAAQIKSAEIKRFLSRD